MLLPTLRALQQSGSAVLVSAFSAVVVEHAHYYCDSGCEWRGYHAERGFAPRCELLRVN